MEPADKVTVVRSMTEAFAQRDADAYLRHMTDDVVVRSTPYVAGEGEYHGHDAVRAGMDKTIRDFARTGKRLRIVDQACYLDGDDESKVCVLARITIQRVNGEEFGTDIAYVSTFEGDRICRVEAWLDHADGLAQLESPIRVA